MKCKIILLIILLFVLLTPCYAIADVEDDLNDNVNQGLDNIDFSQVDALSGDFFESFAVKIKEIISGKFDSGESFFDIAFSIFTDKVKALLPQLSAIFIVLILLGLIRKTNDGFLSESTNNVIHFVGMAVVLTDVLLILMGIYSQVYETLNKIDILSEASLPIMLTLLIANGGNALSSVCQPSMAMFSAAIIKIISSVVLPLAIFSLVFAVVSNLSSNVKVGKMSDFLNSAATWVLGIAFMFFSAFTTVQGISAAKIDGVSYRAAKFATKNYIPILGGYLSDGFDIVMASTSLIKNAFGAVSLLVLFLEIIQPIISILVVNLGLQAVAALCEPVVDQRYIKMLGGISKSLTFLAVMLIAVSFMFCILMLIAICCTAGV